METYLFDLSVLITKDMGKCFFIWRNFSQDLCKRHFWKFFFKKLLSLPFRLKFLHSRLTISLILTRYTLLYVILITSLTFFAQNTPFLSLITNLFLLIYHVHILIIAIFYLILQVLILYFILIKIVDRLIAWHLSIWI